MSRPEALGVAVLIAALFALAAFTERPSWTRRGRHHLRRERITVAQLAHRIAADQLHAQTIRVLWSDIFPELRGVSPEQLGALSV